MAHPKHCGKNCSECTAPCNLDESIPCSPDCEYLNSATGLPDSEECKYCDAIKKYKIKRVLYTTYLANAKKIPEGCIKIMITRFPPKSLPMDIINLKRLSPSASLLNSFKTSDTSWSEFTEAFKEEIKESKEVIDKIVSYVNEGTDVCLICFEKDATHCHRSILAEIFKEKGIEAKEL